MIFRRRGRGRQYSIASLPSPGTAGIYVTTLPPVPKNNLVWIGPLTAPWADLFGLAEAGAPRSF